MARVEDIDSALWGKARFEALSPYAALLYIWSWSNTRVGLAGLYEVGPRAMLECKVPADAIDGALAELAAIRWAFYEDGVMWSCARVDRLRPRSAQMAKGVARAVTAIDVEHPLRVAWMARYGSDAWLREALVDLHRTFARPSPDLHATSDGTGESVTVTPPSPEHQPMFQGKGKGKGERTTATTTETNSSARGVVDQHSLPDEFPATLADKAERVLGMLGAIHSRVCRDGSPAPTLYRLGLAMREFQAVDHEAIGHRVEMWATAPARVRDGRSVDLVSTFRTFCEGDSGPSRRPTSAVVQTSADFVRSLRGAA